jgi:limonene-1,2-epoxide hydrolase
MAEPTEETTVLAFCEAFARKDLDEILGYLADDAVYHNIPFAPARGHDEIRGVLEMFVPGSPTIEFEVTNVASAGSVVFTERVDRMTFQGRDVELPVAGVFEVESGKITAWRDYFDLQQLMGAAPS